MLSEILPLGKTRYFFSIYSPALDN